MHTKNYSFREIVKNTISSFGSKIIPVLISVLSIPILIKNIGDSKFGVLTIAWIFIGYFNLFDLGIGRALTKMISERLHQNRDSEINELLSAGLLGTALLGLIAGGLFVTVSENILHYLNVPDEFYREVIKGLYYLSVGIPFTIMINSLIGALEAIHKFYILIKVQIIFSLLTYSGLLSISFYNSNLAYLIGYLSIIKIVQFIVYIIIIYKQYSIEIKINTQSCVWLKNIISYGGWVTISTIVSPIMTAFDRVFIGATNTMADVTYYSTPNELIQRAGLIPSSFMSVLFPVFSYQSSSLEVKNRRLFTNSMQITGLVSLIITTLFIVWGKEIISVWINNEFAEKSWVYLQILSIGGLFNYLARVPFMYIQAIGKPKITGLIHIIELSIYLPLMFVMSKYYLVIGVAIVTSFRMILDFLLLHLYSIKALKNEGLSSFLIVSIILPIVLSFILVILTPDSRLIRMICYIILLITIMIINWSYYFTPSLKQNIRRTIGRFL